MNSNRLKYLLFCLFPLCLSHSKSCFSQLDFAFEYTDFIDVFNAGQKINHPWSGGLNTPQFSNIDLNNDGYLDLFVFDKSTDEVLTFLHNGQNNNPEYKYTTEYNDNFPKLRNWALLTDYNCDGLPDIFTYVPGGVAVYKNNGDHTFSKVNNLAPLLTDQQGGISLLFINSIDLPAIIDIDGDGDLDIITFGIWGQSLQYHKNMSMENYGVCDSLNSFVLKNDCWGRFTESALNNSITLYDTLNYPCDGSTLVNPQSNQLPTSQLRNDRHVGSTVTALNLNGSTVFDLLIGDIDAKNITSLINGGSSPNQNSSMISFDVNFPSNTTPVNISVFPAAYHVDVNGDNIRDLLVAPHLKSFESYDKNNVVYYINTQQDQQPNFIFQSNSFLVDEMIDVGTGSKPVLFDVDGDGLKDLVVSRNFTSFPNPQNARCGLTLYQNTGTINQPEYTYITNDFAGITSLNLGKELSHTFGDIDGDGDQDLLIGLGTGELFWMENTGTSGSSQFNSGIQILEDNNGDPITTSGSSAPQLFDINNNGFEDLVIGQRNGKIDFYERDPVDLSFNFVTNELGKVDVKEYWDIIGYSSPFFMRHHDTLRLFCGSKSGNIYSYIVKDNKIDSTFYLVDSTSWNIYNGYRSSLWIEDLNNDNILEMITGNLKGGLHLYSAIGSSNLHTNEIGSKYFIKIHPNPTSNFFKISTNYKKIDYIKIFNTSGELVLVTKEPDLNQYIDISELKSGVYVMIFQIENYVTRQKLVKF